MFRLLCRWTVTVVFALPLIAAPAALRAAPEDSLELTGEIRKDDPVDPVRKQPGKVHEVKFSKGKTYQIDLTSDDFDSYLRLEDPNGKEVAKNDDGGGGLNARIKYTPSEDGTFKVYATTFLGGEGKYVLKVQGPGGAAGAGGKDVVLTVNDAIQDGDQADPVRNHPGKVHSVKLKKDTTYQIDLISDQFDAYLRLENNAGKELAKDDDGGDRLNSRIRFTPSEEGDYKIFATTFAGGTGGYNLTVKAVAAPMPAAKLPLPTADKPATMDGKIDPTDPADPVRRRPSKFVEVELKQGKSYVIDMASENFDTFLRLESSTGQKLAENDDNGENLNSRIVFACPADGQYRIYLTSFAGGSGAFSLRVAEQP